MVKKYAVSNIFLMEEIVDKVAEDYAERVDDAIFEEITGKRIWRKDRIRREMLEREACRKSMGIIQELNIRCYHDFHPSI